MLQHVRFIESAKTLQPAVPMATALVQLRVNKYSSYSIPVIAVDIHQYCSALFDYFTVTSDNSSCCTELLLYVV